MVMDMDQVLDRRRMKRRLVLWRLAALGLAAGLLWAVFGPVGGIGGFGDRARDHVARLAVTDIITTDAELERGLADLGTDDAVRAVIVRLNSPGGTAAGGEALYRSLRRLAAAKPVVAVMDETATSAAYMAALAADHIIARESSVTGSIGVIFQSADVTGLLAKLGIKPEAIRSGPLKARPNPLEETGPEARAATERVVADIHDMFVGFFADRRGLARPQAEKLADGRVFTGREALKLGLIDGLGGEAAALEWLESARGIAPGLPVRDFAPRGGPLERAGFLGALVEKVVFSESLRLDGLLSLWHPEGL